MGLATELYLFGEKSFFSREIVKPAIVISAYSCVMVHNHPAATLVLLKRIWRLTRRINGTSRILRLQLIDHVIIGSPPPKRNSYFSFKESGVMG